MKREVLFLAGITAMLFVAGCKDDEGFVLMPRSQEVELGNQLDSTILANPADYPILSRIGNEQAYQFLENMMNDILDNTEEDFSDAWDWKITIINKDVMNAFAAPGGKLYFYTGLMKYLDNSANMAGVMAHEMAHVEKRHSAKQMQKYYGVNFAASILFGTDKSKLEQIVTDIGSGLAALQFSREDEYQADEYSVKFLYGTRSGKNYDPKGISGFFEKLNTDGKTNETWEVLSSHPSDQNRLDNIDEVWKSLNSPTGEVYTNEYSSFKALLPQ